MISRLTDVPTACDAIQMIQSGSLSQDDYLGMCSRAIDQHESQVRAFACTELNPKRIGGGPLDGIPIGVKDVIDTSSLPTQYNSPLYEGRQAANDAGCVSVLRANGALILGKTATVEFASLGQVAETVNPHNTAHTPGGSSSGSAAAVATGMVPIALGTQTGGSIIRPASFCGVAALKPTFGIVPINGLRPYAPSLDTIGWMARSVADLQLVFDCFNSLEAPLRQRDSMRIGFYRTAFWDKAESATRAALEIARQKLIAAGHRVTDVERLDKDDCLNAAQDTIMHAEGRLAFLAEYSLWPERLHEESRREVENASRITTEQIADAYDLLAELRPRLEQAMSNFDCWLVPAVPGEAPVGLEKTGDAVFNRLWTGLHVPAVTLPCTTGSAGLPVGIQLVAPRYADRRLLALAADIEALLNVD